MAKNQKNMNFKHQYKSNFLLTLATGILFGFSFACLILNVILWEKQKVFNLQPSSLSRKYCFDYEDFNFDLQKNPYQLKNFPSSKFKKPFNPIKIHQHNDSKNDLAKTIFNKVRVLCWIMTNPHNHKKKAIHVKHTWAKHCNKYLFMSTTEDSELNTIKLNVKEGRNQLWSKTRSAFLYVFDNHLDDADWFVKADDDTYMIIENLRHLLNDKNSSDASYFGCLFKPFVKNGYMSGGSGYVLSKNALERLASEFKKNDLEKKYGNCASPTNTGPEDVLIGKCLNYLNVKAEDTRDNEKRYKFLPLAPEYHLIPHEKNFWFYKYIYYPIQEGMNCCSDYAVSFHYVTPNQMYVMEYLIYHLKPYGVDYYENTDQKLIKPESNQTSKN